MTDEGRLLTVDEVAELVRADPSTVRRKIRDGEIAATKPCGQYLVSEGEVRRLLERARVRATNSQRASAPAMPSPPPGRAPGGSFRSRRRRDQAA